MCPFAAILQCSESLSKPSHRLCTAEARGWNPLGSTNFYDTFALSESRPGFPRWCGASEEAFSSRGRLGAALRRFGVVVGGSHLETAAWSLTTVAPLVDGHARYFADQSLGHATHLGVVRCQCGQRAAVALND